MSGKIAGHAALSTGGLPVGSEVTVVSNGGTAAGRGGGRGIASGGTHNLSGAAGVAGTASSGGAPGDAGFLGGAGGGRGAAGKPGVSGSTGNTCNAAGGAAGAAGRAVRTNSGGTEPRNAQHKDIATLTDARGGVAESRHRVVPCSPGTGLNLNLAQQRVRWK